MIREAIDRVLNLAPCKIIKDDFGRQFWDKSGHMIPDPAWPQVKLATLTGLKEYIADAHKAKVPEGAFILVEGPLRVLFRGPVVEPRKDFDIYAEAVCGPLRFAFGNWYDVESFIIALQTQFVKDETTDKLLKLVGNLSNETSVATLDNGYTQEVTAKVGVVTVEKVEVPNPVELRPYRTFREVEQPKSKYVFRMRRNAASKDVSCALFDVGEDAWEIEAIKNIKAWLTKELERPDLPVIG